MNKNIVNVNLASSLNLSDYIFINKENSLQQIKAKDFILNIVYPVGAVYISYEATSPAALFGGTWTAITGKFPYFNAGTATGGSNTHTLTTAQMPSHTHTFTGTAASHGHAGSKLRLTAGKVASGSTYSRVNEQGTGISSLIDIATVSLTPKGTNSATGGGSAHNNMPAYQTLYAWRRVE